MKIFFSCLFLLSMAFCQIASAEEPDMTVKELSDKKILHEIVRYLYRWYLDEADIEATSSADADLDFQIRQLNPKLDQGDNSRFAEVRIPLWKVAVRMKKADYRIEELDRDVKSNSFKITNVSRITPETETPADLISVKVNLKDMREYLFNTRNQPEYPSEELMARSRKIFKDEFDALRKKHGAKVDFPTDAAEISIYLAPLSPVSNEIWAYREFGHFLIRCSSDIDISNPTVWENERLFFHVYDAYNQVVVSLDETAGSNEFMTRNQMGRALYNCIVLGKKITVKKDAAKPDDDKSDKRKD